METLPSIFWDYILFILKEVGDEDEDICWQYKQIMLWKLYPRTGKIDNMKQGENYGIFEHLFETEKHKSSNRKSFF